MNKRIKKLYKEALAEAGNDGEAEMVEKFAELIIKETLIIARAGMEYGPSMDEVVYGYFGLKE